MTVALSPRAEAQPTRGPDMTSIRHVPRIPPALLLALTLALLAGCKEKKPEEDQAETSWQQRCSDLERRIEQERERADDALRGQARLRAAMGWWGMGAAACLIVGVVLGSTTKRLVQGANANAEPAEPPGQPEDQIDSGDSGRDHS
ncbi:MAG: hypothetical protein HN380_26220 [Victivallales bacterium]|jgi:outer membrane biogenesis lipoprotein LolB|nr:hypothetical protein [Victivallales bacterium]